MAGYTSIVYNFVGYIYNNKHFRQMVSFDCGSTWPGAIAEMHIGYSPCSAIPMSVPPYHGTMPVMYGRQ